MNPESTQPVAPVAPQPTSYPGKVLGIVGFILSFVGFQLVGLILCIVALNQSKKAGFKNILALVGIILNAIFLFFGIGILAAITIVAYGGITEKANTVKAQTNAESVVKVAEAINADSGVYPTTASDFQTGSFKLSGDIQLVADSTDLSEADGLTSIAYVPADVNTDGKTDGGTIYYWDFQKKAVSSEVLYAGDAMDAMSASDMDAMPSMSN